MRPDGNGPDAEALSVAGFEVVVDPYLQLGPARDPRPAARLLERMLDIAGDAELARSAWVVLTSARTVPMWQVLVGADRLERALTEASRAGVRIGAIGAATAASLPGEHSASLVAPHPRAAALAEALRRAQPGGGTALFPGSSQALPTLPAQLRAHGWTVESAAVYETAPASQRPASADGLAADGFDALLLRSPSAVAAVALYAGRPGCAVVATVGPVTTAAARALGWEPVELTDTDPRQVAGALAARLAAAPAAAATRHTQASNSTSRQGLS